MAMLKPSSRAFRIVFKDRFFYRSANVLFHFFLFLLFLLFTASFYNLGRFLEKTSSSVTFYAFVKKNIPAAGVEAMRRSVANWPEVNKVRVIGQEEGLAVLKRSLGKDSSILNTLEGNPLPLTLEINVKSAFAEKTALAGLREKLRRDDRLDWSDSTERYLGPLLELKKFLNVLFLVGVIVLVLLIVLSLKTTVRSLFHRYRDAVALLRLLGASQGFIVTPLVIEGFFETFISAALAATASFNILAFVAERLARLGMDVTPLPDSIYMAFVLAVSFVGGLSGLTFKKIPEP